jgi:hypothetical protein
MICKDGLQNNKSADDPRLLLPAAVRGGKYCKNSEQAIVYVIGSNLLTNHQSLFWRQIFMFEVLESKTRCVRSLETTALAFQTFTQPFFPMAGHAPIRR